MSTRTYEDFHKWLGANPARLGIVSNLYKQYTASALTEALMNVYEMDKGKSNSFQSINSFLIEWDIDVNFVNAFVSHQLDKWPNWQMNSRSFGGYDGNDAKVLESNWNWDVFKSSINLSNVTITVTNNGDDTADIRYVVIYPDGEEHFQNYLGIKVNSADLQAALVTEGSYLVLYE